MTTTCRLFWTKSRCQVSQSWSWRISSRDDQGLPVRNRTELAPEDGGWGQREVRCASAPLPRAVPRCAFATRRSSVRLCHAPFLGAPLRLCVESYSSDASGTVAGSSRVNPRVYACPSDRCGGRRIRLSPSYGALFLRPGIRPRAWPMVHSAWHSAGSGVSMRIGGTLARKLVHAAPPLLGRAKQQPTAGPEAAGARGRLSSCWWGAVKVNRELERMACLACILSGLRIHRQISLCSVAAASMPRRSPDAP